eukprot:363443-Ditylum_brightwellii.AAC.1
MKLAAVTCRLQKHKEKTNCTRSNKIFEKSNNRFYNSLRSVNSTITDPSTQEYISKFWKQLFGKIAKHNKNAAWLQVEEESVTHVPAQQWIDITIKELHQTVRKLTN